jgi:hypothetical protein
MTLRALRTNHPALDHAWPGVLFKDASGSESFDIDLLASDGDTVYAAECKLDARGLGTNQTASLLSFAQRVGATPVVAAVAGEFDPEVAGAVRNADGLILDRADLVS